MCEQMPMEKYRCGCSALIMILTEKLLLKSRIMERMMHKNDNVISYDDLVCRINEGLNGTTLYHDAFGEKTGKPLQEVNAWTYWQGYKVRNPKVMIVGQDWGSLNRSSHYLDAIDDMIMSRDLDNEVQYFKYIPETERGGKDFSTDLNLAECLKCIGYEDVLHKRYDDLFFTNLIPGYRNSSKSTGGFKAAWVTKQVKQDFKDLVFILNPSIIICLGKDTFKQVCMAYGIRGVLKRKSWIEFLDEQTVPVEILDESGLKVHIFASAHPGYFGVLNRGKDRLLEDWERINHWMKDNVRETLG